MKQIGDRLRTLRESVTLSQAKMADCLGVQQSSITRYEKGLTEPSADVLLKYADFFDVSMDYIYARTDNPQGAHYEYKPKVQTDNAELKQFIDMCFDPSSPMSTKLKDTLYTMMMQEEK